VRKLENKVILYRRVADFLERHLAVGSGGEGDAAGSR
jgi:hypothetical protein